MLTEACDQDGDLRIDECEMFDCVVEVENHWRDDWCPPEFGHSYCHCPFEPDTCDGFWLCGDVIMATEEIFAFYNVDGDKAINPSDNIDSAKYAEYMTMCDVNDDGNIDFCEMLECTLVVEN
jgi:hypothetical protein